MGDWILVFVLLALFILAIYGLIWSIRNYIYQMRLRKRSGELEKGFEDSNINIFVAFTNLKTKEIESIVKKHLEGVDINTLNKNDSHEDMDDEEQIDIFYKYHTIESFNVLLKHDPKNQYDENAIKVLVDDVEVGFIPKKDLEIVNKNINRTLYKAIISEGIVKSEYREKNQKEQFKIILVGTNK